MIAFMLGEENRAKPNPRTMRQATVNHMSVSAPIRVSSSRASAVMPIPVDARIRGSIRSESLPAKGENRAITTG